MERYPHPRFNSRSSSGDTLIGTPEPQMYKDKDERFRPVQHRGRGGGGSGVFRSAAFQRIVVWVFLFGILGFVMWTGRKGPLPWPQPYEAEFPVDDWPDDWYYDDDEYYDDEYYDDDLPPGPEEYPAEAFPPPADDPPPADLPPTEYDKQFLDKAEPDAPAAHEPKQAEKPVEKPVEKPKPAEKVAEPVVEAKPAPVEEKVEEPEQQMSDDDRFWAEHWDILHANTWLKFDYLDGYWNGLKTLVKKKDHVAQYPNLDYSAKHQPPERTKTLPKPQPYSPYDTKSNMKTCYLDDKEKIPAPDIYAYDGVPQDMPDPAIGSYELLGLRDDICFDRWGRYGAYGLGYPRTEGGIGTGQDTEMAESDHVWAKTGKINYDTVDWGKAQKRCSESNRDKFLQVDPETGKLSPEEGKKGRTAVVIRIYTGFKWTQHAVLNFRAMINELSLKAGGEYAVHFLLHVKEEDVAIWADDSTAQQVLDANVPTEFHSLCSMWSEAEMKLYYPGDFQDPIEDPSHKDIHGVYRSAHFPLQVFAINHPEYEHFWNWEMDLRYVGSYYELFDRVGQWADKQPRQNLWERNERYYIPSYHNTWENFTATVEDNIKESKRAAVFGRLNFKENAKLRFEEQGISALPENCLGKDKTECGVGEPADFISFNPIFDTEESGWVFASDVTGYGRNPPRRGVIITAARLSRRLLESMHEEVWRFHHSMFTEMFPPSVAFHHGLKGVFAPHPVFLDRAWNPPYEIDKGFNSGRDHSTSGHGSPFDLWHEYNEEPSTFYYNSKFAGQLWRRWLGYAMPDNRGEHEAGVEAGGLRVEGRGESTGRMCLRSMLVHPIKWEHPSE